MQQLLCRAHNVILFFYFSIVGNVNLYFTKLASDMLHWIAILLILKRPAKKVTSMTSGVYITPDLNINIFAYFCLHYHARRLGGFR